MLERRWGLQAAEGSFPPMSQEGRPQAASQVLVCTDSVLGPSVHALLSSASVSTGVQVGMKP